MEYTIHNGIHRITPSNNSESPLGLPDVNYFFPQVNSNDVVDYITPVSREEMCTQRVALTGCTDQFGELNQMIMEDEVLEVPNTPDDAKAL
jgi:hypothetical protein